MSSYLDELFGLSGRTAVVTGGSSGIGRAMALALGRAGARIVLVARREAPMAEVVAELRGHGADAHAISADLADRAAVKAVTSKIIEGYGEPDILVNSAGINLRPPLDELTDDVWDVTLAANLTAPFLLGQAFGPAMARRGWGRIINVVSQQAFRAYGNSGAYGAAKAGLVGLTRSQAEAWSQHGVCCNAIAPGVVHTPLTDVVFADPTKVAAHARRTMIGRNGVPEDFAGCVVFLASEAGQAVTGQTLFVDGGYSAT
ncbi:gluconate 5-dehydrogenase [Actinoplanes campanulatus]|uniref:Gluconate 5-dehydrogenase n=1 Tax=Actinoplanes campanulatus TaxID=113559 RepID=A0A7W5AS71_9ACTN|nr:SDR family oxidoreductase [Actinoplanes campanulatus]MBB3100879.1 gluconate 5-dehydrogenase [Actinoplanes campanulatus]GGN46926.1 gluconate 5-dehydrogenase [Actinoplanes campanulatus]GID41435.1 gluconate 5-dehydrogenase [Actinoplanes campanulatus]